MPDGSSSAAPVTSPGPRRLKYPWPAQRSAPAVMVQRRTSECGAPDFVASRGGRVSRTLLRTMKIAEILARGPSYSFEFFPPRTPAAEIALTAALEELEPLGPSYVSVTYGAGGSTREKTHEIVTGILRDTSMTPMAHLTCVGHTRAELEEIVDPLRRVGDREHPGARRRSAARRRAAAGRARSTRSSWCS